MPRLIACFLLLTAAPASASPFTPALPAVLEVPIPPSTVPTPASGTATFLNPANEELTLTVTSEITGPEGNGIQFDFAFARLGSLAPSVDLIGNLESGFVLQLNADRPSVLLSEIGLQIDALPGFNASFGGPFGSDRSIASLPDSGLTLTGGVGFGGTTEDVLLELVGIRPGDELFLGAELILVNEGTPLDQLVDLFNLLTRSTFVEAAAVDGNLRLSSLEVGSRAFLELNVVIEAGGDNDPKTFTDALGTERVTVFGVDAVVPEPNAAAILLVAAIGTALGRRPFAL